jgi:hypothetical protein
MKMTLNHEEINEAIVDWVAKQGIDLADKETTVELTAGRGMNGNSASIDIKPINHRLQSTAANVSMNVPRMLHDSEVSVEFQEVGNVTEVEPSIPDDTPVLHTDF